MTSQVFYRKWRPQSLAEVAGQEQVTQTLLNALATGRVSHAYLFSGPRGTGKTSTGRILAKAVNCLTSGHGEPCNTCDVCRAITEGRSLDVIEVDAASNRRIDEIRELRERVNYAPNQARYKVYIIDEVHMLTTEAANALLKTLEEPPQHVIFILATTEPHKLLPTILSRCQRFDFKRIAQKDVAGKLTEICQKESIQIQEEALRLVGQSAQGSLRDAENLLEQLVAYYGKEISLLQVQEVLGISEDARTRDFLTRLIEGDIGGGLMALSSAGGDGLDLKQFNRQLVSYLRSLLLLKTGANVPLDYSADDIAALKKLAEKTTLSRVLRALKVFSQLDFGTDTFSTLPLEVALIDVAMPGEENDRASKKSAPVEAPAVRPETARASPPVRKPNPEAARPAAETAKPAAPLRKPEPVATKPAAPKADKVEEKPAEPPAAAPEKKEPPAKSGEPLTELDRLKLNWRQVIAGASPDINRTTAVAMLRSACKVVGVEGDTVVLAFKYPIHKDKMSAPENKKIAEKLISSFLGKPCQVRCTYEPEANHLVQEAQKLGAQIMSVEEKWT